jgi:hypothetical protein
MANGTIRIADGQFKGRYAVEGDRVQWIQWANRDGVAQEVRTTVGRGTARHRAVMAAVGEGDE